MWIYTPESPEKQTLAPQESPESSFSEFSERAVVCPQKNKRKIPPQEKGCCAEEKQPSKCTSVVFCTRKNRIYDMLLFILGLSTSGILLQLHPVPPAMLQFLSKNAISVFTRDTMTSFSILFLSAFLLLTLEFILGLSVISKLCSGLVFLLYGIGTGIFCLALLKIECWKGWIFHALLPGAFACVLFMNLHRIAAGSVRSSEELLDLLRQKTDPPAHRETVRRLADLYGNACISQGISVFTLLFVGKTLVSHLFRI